MCHLHGIGERTKRIIVHQTCVNRWLQIARTCPKCRVHSTVARGSKLLRLEFTEHPELRSLQERENVFNETLQVKEATINSMNDRIHTLETQLIVEKESSAALTLAKNKTESDKNIEVAKMKTEIQRLQAELLTMKKLQGETELKIKDLQFENSFLSLVENVSLKSNNAELKAKLDQSTRLFRDSTQNMQSELNALKIDHQEMVEENTFLKAELILNDIEGKSGNESGMRMNMGFKRKNDEHPGEPSTKNIKRFPDMPAL